MLDLNLDITELTKDSEITTPEELRKELLRTKKYSEDTLLIHKSLLSEAIQLSKSTDGLRVPLMTLSRGNVNYDHPVAMINNATNVLSERERYVCAHDPVYIFDALYESKLNEIKSTQKYSDELIAQAEKDWYYYSSRTPEHQRYSAFLDRKIDRQFFLDHPYRCPGDMTNKCIVRLKDPRDFKFHYHF
jgi:hypothetical protein